MQYEEALGYIHSLKRFSSRPTLDRIKALCHRLGDPQKQLAFFHVAGTNGKGSICAMAAAAFEEGGYRTGLYTSPYVTDFRERFQLNGKVIGKEALARLTGRVKEAAQTVEDGVNEFEFNTALAILWFLEEKADIVVWEVGLGGRFDATNVIPCPEAAVIASISLDHTAVLGDTPEKIAKEKAGILKGGKAVLYPIQPDGVAETVFEAAALTGSTLILPNPRSVEILEEAPFKSRFAYRGEEYTLSLSGRHQIYNAITAIEAIRAAARFPLSERDLKRGLARAFMPVRFERVSDAPLTILDGAHNPGGTRAFVAAMGRIGASPKVGVIGMLADKDFYHGARTLASAFDAVITVTVNNPRSASAEEILEAVEGVCPRAETAPSPEAALRRAQALAGEGGAVAVAGSIFLAGELRGLFFPLQDE